MNETLPFDDLWNEILLAFRCEGSLRRLQNLLIQHKTSFLTPLQRKGKDPTLRADIQRGKISIDGVTWSLTPEHRDEAVKISDDLDLNEVECVKLFNTTLHKSSRYGMSVMEAAEELFFKNRQLLLLCLHDLLKGRLDVRNSRLHALMVNFTTSLVEDGLVGNLLAIIKKFTLEKGAGERSFLPVGPGVSSETKSRRLAFCKVERQELAYAIFFVAYDNLFLRCSRDEIVQLVELLDFLSEKLKDNDKDASLAALTSTMTLSLIHMFLAVSHPEISKFDEGRDGEEGNNRGIGFFDDDAFITRLQRVVLERTWANQRVQSVVMLAWSTVLFSRRYIEDVDDAVASTFHKAVRLGAFDQLTHIVKSWSFQSDTDHNPLFYEVLDLLVVDLLTKMSALIREVKLNEEEAISALGFSIERRGRSSKPKPAPPHFEELLGLIAVIYEGRPEAGLAFWEKEERGDLRKFVRFAGDPVNERFFEPYMQMLSALAGGSECAVQAYYFLKETSNKTINWDHFFRVIEHYGQDLQQSSAGVRASAPVKEMQPGDVTGLIAILRFLTVVLTHSEHTRSALFESRSATPPMLSLFNLLRCPVPANLKAELMNTISAFCHSPEISKKVWPILEAKQLLQTIRAPEGRAGVTPLGASSGLSESSGILFELEERESNTREYRQTIAFCNLIFQLLRNSSPEQLAEIGAGYRRPGIGPYLEFIRDHVFLKFDTRGYNNPAERWRVAAAALRVIDKLLETYGYVEEEPVGDGMYDYAEGQAAHPPPTGGFQAMLGFLAGSTPLLGKLLQVLSHTYHDVKLQIKSADGRFFEDSMMLSLKVLATVMEKEDMFREEERAMSVGSGVLKPIGQQLLTRPDCVTTIAEFICYEENPEIQLHSVHIVGLLSQRQEQIVNVFRLSGEERASAILRGYVAALSESSRGQDGDAEAAAVRGANPANVRPAILRLMLDNLTARPPNVVHFLLGFDGDPLEDTVLDRSDQYTCLQVLIHLLDSPTFRHTLPHLANMCYQFMFQLCADRRTGRLVMRYLGDSQRDFFWRQLSKLPFQIDEEHKAVQLMQGEGLLKMLALEIHVTVETEQRRATQRLLSILFDGPMGADEGALQGFAELVLGDMPRGPNALRQERMKVVELLDPVDFHVPLPNRGALQHGNTFYNEDMLEACAQVDPRTELKLVDVRRLHGYLLAVRESRDTGFRSTAHANVKYQSEIADVLAFATQLNQYNILVDAKQRYFEAWKQVVEVTLSKGYQFLSASSTGEAILFYLAEVLLHKHNNDPLLVEKTSSVALFLLTKLREQKTALSRVDGIDFMRVDRLLAILRHLVQGLIAHGSTQYTRTNLCGALVNYLQFTSRTGTIALNNPPLGFEEDFFAEQWSQETHEREAQQRQLDRENFSILRDVGGEKLVHILSSDAAYGSPVCKSVALAALNMFMAHDREDLWLQFLTHRGFVRGFLEDFVLDGGRMSGLLGGDPDALNALFVYESKQALLLRIASNPLGARHLMDHGILRILSDTLFIDWKPEAYGVHEEEGWFPNAGEIHHQLLVPVLQLVLGLLTALPRNRDAATQALEFVRAHSDLILGILGARSLSHSDTSSLAHLQELELVSALFYRLAAHEGIPGEACPTSKEMMESILGLGAARMHHLLLRVLCKYCSEDRWLEHVRKKTVDGDGGKTCTLVREICRNVLAYARVTMLVSMQDGVFIALFKPVLEMSEARKDLSRASGPPPLSMLVHFLQDSLSDYRVLNDKLRHRRDRMQHINDLPVEELTKLALQTRFMTADVNPQQKLQLAQLCLSDIISDLEKRIFVLVYIMENTLVLLWKHIEFFIQKKPTSVGSPAPSAARGVGGRSKGVPTDPWGGGTGPVLSRQQVKKLQRDAVSFLEPVLTELPRELESSPVHQAEAISTTFSLVYAIVRTLKDMLRPDDSRPRS